MISKLYSKPTEQIISSIPPFNESFSFATKGSGKEKSLGFSFNIFDNGNIYHPFCYSELKKTGNGD